MNEDFEFKMNIDFPEKVVRIIFGQENKKEIINYIKSNEVYQYSTRFGRPLMTNDVEIGNGCITGIDYTIAKTLQEKFYIEIDNITTLVTKVIMEQLQEGKKIQFEQNPITKTIVKATVTSNNGQILEVKKYRCKSKGYRMFIGQDCNLVIGW